MTTWVKEINNQLHYATASEFPGVPNPLTHEAKLRDKGYMPLRDSEHEDREGYKAVPATWHKVPKTEVRDEPRNCDPVTGEPFIEYEWEIDPETGEKRKTGEHQVTRIVPVEFDKSYIQVDAWEYHEIPAPEPPPLKRQFSKGDLLEALMALNLYDQAKAIYAADLDLQIAWAGFANIDMDYSACQAIMQQYPDLFTPENVEALQRFITFGELPNAQ